VDEIILAVSIGLTVFRAEKYCVGYWENVMSGYSFAYKKIFLARHEKGLEVNLHGVTVYFRFILWVEVEIACIVHQGADRKGAMKKFSVQFV
jgi:hypothetical protein